MDITKEDYEKARCYGINKVQFIKMIRKYKATPEQIFTGAETGKSLKHVRCDYVEKDGVTYTVFMKRSGQSEPHTARILVDKWFYDHGTGGWRGWETRRVYDKTFVDWHYAHLLYKRILEGSE